MSNKNKLIKNTIIIGIGKLGTQIITFLLMPLYTFILTTDEYGTYDFITTISLFIIPCITLLLEEAMFRFLIDANNEDERNKIITQSTLFICIWSIIFLFCLYIFLNIINYSYKEYLILYIFSSLVQVTIQALVRGIGNFRIYSLGSFSSSTIIILLNVLTIIFLKMGVRGLLISYSIGIIFVYLIIFLKLKLYLYIKLELFDLKLLFEMIKYALPLIPNSISWVIINLSDRLIITSLLGTSANGIYAIANKFPSIINTFYGFFFTAWQEDASKALKDNNASHYYNMIYDNLKKLLFSVSICVMSIMPFIFPILINKEYHQAYRYIPLLIISIFFSNLSGFYGGIFTAYKETKVMGITTLYAAIINLLITLFFVKSLGINAAVISTLVSNLFVYIYRYINIKRYISFRKDYNFFYWSCLILGINICCYYSNILLVNLMGFLVSIIFTLYFNKIIFKVLSQKFKKKVVI